VFRSDSLLSTFYDIGRDLLSLEVNTIEKPNLTARKMPVLPHALLDIAEVYRDWLAERLDLSDYWSLTALPRQEWSPAPQHSDRPESWRALELTTGWETFDKLRWAAARALWADPKVLKLERPDMVIMSRIRRNCDLLKKMIEDLSEEAPYRDLLRDRTRQDLLDRAMRRKLSGRLPMDDAIMLRKVWDMGVESVCVQTVIQIDGDVITRVQEDLDARKRTLIMEIHAGSIEVSLKYWETLVRIVERIAGSFTRLFMPRAESGE
jgi:hypothetical protein